MLKMKLGEFFSLENFYASNFVGIVWGRSHSVPGWLSQRTQQGPYWRGWMSLVWKNLSGSHGLWTATTVNTFGMNLKCKMSLFVQHQCPTSQSLLDEYAKIPTVCLASFSIKVEVVTAESGWGGVGGVIGPQLWLRKHTWRQEFSSSNAQFIYRRWWQGRSG